MAQIGTGVLVGGVICVYVLVFLFGIPGSQAVAGLLLPSAAVLMLVGLVACGLPVRRALRIEPTEALKEVG